MREIASHHVVYIPSVLFWCSSSNTIEEIMPPPLMAEEEKREQVEPEDDFVFSFAMRGALSGQRAGSFG